MFGLSAAWRTVIGIVTAVLMLVGIFYGYRAYDRYKQRERQRQLDAANANVHAADTLIAQADTIQSQILTTKRGFNGYVNSKEVQSNPIARHVADTATKIIRADSITINKQKKAIAHLDSAVTEYQNASPPVGPRAVPYLDVGYGASSRHRAVPVARVGLDYRLLPHVFAKLEGSYEPPPAGSAQQSPELRVLVAAHISFR